MRAQRDTIVNNMEECIHDVTISMPGLSELEDIMQKARMMRTLYSKMTANCMRKKTRKASCYPENEIYGSFFQQPPAIPKFPIGGQALHYEESPLYNYTELAKEDVASKVIFYSLRVLFMHISKGFT